MTIVALIAGILIGAVVGIGVFLHMLKPWDWWS